MKKSIVLFAIGFALCICSVNANHRVIQSSQLPEAAQKFLNSHFAHEKVMLAKTDYKVFFKEYDVKFASGNKIEFDKEGNWTEINCKMSHVPTAAVPEKIATYVKTNYPANVKIVSIEKERKGYEVKLSNKWELKFNHQFELTDIDD